MKLSVIVPVYNQASSVAENVATIHDRVAAGVDGEIEVIVVSDGSVDRTVEQALTRAGSRIRVLHYDRNLGKGYAVKLGVREARGRFVAYCDSDLDLDPGMLPRFLRAAEERRLDLVIGSKRHPESLVHYPRSRRASSWCFQQLIRMLFRFDVRDTQVGMKLFSRDVAEQVFPALLVKRYAFDIELLAVAREFGFDQIEEQPVRLDYRFTGSGVRSLAVGRALVDVAAIAYRLKLLRYYQRRRTLFGALGAIRAERPRPLVSIVGGDASHLDYWPFERVEEPDAALGEVIALVHPNGVPAGNWLSATVPYLDIENVGAVVTPLLAPAGGSLRHRTAAALRESRLGGGSQYFRYTPGNLRFVDSYPAGSLVVRGSALALLQGVPPDARVETISATGFRVVYTPESVVVAPAEPLVAPHAAAVASHGRSRGRRLRRSGPRALSPAGLALLVVLPTIVMGAPLAVLGGPKSRRAWLFIAGGYGIAVAGGSAAAGLRFRSPAVAFAALPGVVLTHAAYVSGVIGGMCER